MTLTKPLIMRHDVLETNSIRARKGGIIAVCCVEREVPRKRNRNESSALTHARKE